MEVDAHRPKDVPLSRRNFPNEAPAVAEPVPGLLNDIIARNFLVRGGQLQLGGIDASQLAEAHGTPLFVYDAALIRNKVAAARQALGDRFDLYYSIKANPNDAVLRLMLQLGCGLEVASAGELEVLISTTWYGVC